MLRIEVKQKVKKPELYRTCPKEEDAPKLISESCELLRDGKPWLSYIENAPLLEELRKATLGVKTSVSTRQSGVAAKSRTFGFFPRAALQQRNYCYRASVGRDYAKHSMVLDKYAAIFSEMLKELHPEQAEISRKELEGVKQDWKIDDSLFTSGIINEDTPLKYHYDAGNLKNTWSVMAVFKNQIAGGHLILPEYGLKLACNDNSIVIFDGQKELHGVSPIIKMDKNAYRRSIVYYSLENLCHCGTVAEEIARAQIQRTKTEMKRAGISL